MTLPPVRRQVLVACDQTTAYRLFVDDIGTWWPLESFGCFGAGSTVVFDGDRFVETAPSGETAVWGTVTTADPPNSLTFTWHPGMESTDASQVTVMFTATGDPATTLVTLEHSGWEAYPDPDAARTEYSGGWVSVLDRYAAARPAPRSTATHWFVLEHTAGPATPPGGISASPDFAKHAQFLQALHDDGALVAAGPLPDSSGTGMTVVRVTGMDAARRVVSAAQYEDGSVTCGLLDVRVRPWRVVLSSG